MSKYKVVNKNGKKAFDDTFTSKKAATQSIIDAIKGGSNERAKKYITYKVRKSN